MSANMPILYRNIMDGLPSDYARRAFLWATERAGDDHMCYRAEAFAREAYALVRSVSDLLDIHGRVADETGTPGLTAAERADLEAFFATRHANYRFGGNLKATYVEAAE